MTTRSLRKHFHCFVDSDYSAKYHYWVSMYIWVLYSSHIQIYKISYLGWMRLSGWFYMIIHVLFHCTNLAFRIKVFAVLIPLLCQFLWSWEAYILCLLFSQFIILLYNPCALWVITDNSYNYVKTSAVMLSVHTLGLWR